MCFKPCATDQLHTVGPLDFVQPWSYLSVLEEQEIDASVVVLWVSAAVVVAPSL